jgi:hypothetical protein
MFSRPGVHLLARTAGSFLHDARRLRLRDNGGAVSHGHFVDTPSRPIRRKHTRVSPHDTSGVVAQVSGAAPDAPSSTEISRLKDFVTTQLKTPSPRSPGKAGLRRPVTTTTGETPPPSRRPGSGSPSGKFVPVLKRGLSGSFF